MLRRSQRGHVLRYLGDRVYNVYKDQYRTPDASIIAQNNKSMSSGIRQTYVKSTCVTDNRKSHQVYATQTFHRIHVNLEDLTNEKQAVFCRCYIDELKSKVVNHEIKRINFNCINEDVFRYHVNMQIRKLGYTSSFQRYNEDRGLAEFIVSKKS